MSDSTARSRRRTLWTLAKTALALVLMAFVLSRTSVDELLQAARQASVGWLALAAVAFCGSAWFLTLRYWVLIRRQVSLPQLFGVVVLQNAISNFAATGLGAVSYVAMLRGEHEVTAGRGVASLLLARIGDLFALLPVLAASSYFVWAQIEPLHAVILPLLAAMTVALAMLLLIVAFRQPFRALVRSVQNKLGPGGAAVVARALNWISGLGDDGRGRLASELGLLALYSCLVMASSGFWVYCMVRAFAVPIDAWPVVFVVALTQLMAVVPIQVFGGLGVYEFTSIYLYGLFGVGQAEAAALTVGIRIALSVLTLVLLLYLPARNWIAPKISRGPAEHV